MVGRFIEQQHVGFAQQQAAQRHAALFTAGEIAADGIPRRNTQGIGGDFQLLFEGVGVAAGQNRFQALLFGGQFVEIGVRFGIGGVHRVQFGLGMHQLAHAFFHGLAHGVLGVQARFLFQVADLDARLRAGFTGEVFIDAGHDAQHGRLAGAVQAEQADFGAREEADSEMSLMISRFGGTVFDTPIMV